ncbi:MAG: hypothetical protein HY549_02585 [Elusimicrobia bacterium]|nr:hypothetical protein [Elusimicrobiota bacterium]
MAMFCGASLGGLLADNLPPILGYPIHALFLISAVMRFTADSFLAKGFSEVRAVAAPARCRDIFFSVVGMRPLVGDNMDIEWEPLSGAPRELPGDSRTQSRR